MNTMKQGIWPRYVFFPVGGVGETERKTRSDVTDLDKLYNFYLNVKTECDFQDCRSIVGRSGSYQPL